MGDFNNKIQDDEIDLKTFFRTVKREKNFIISITLITTLASILYSYLKKPTYMGSFNIVVQAKSSVSVGSEIYGDLKSFTSDVSGTNANETQKVILMSPSVLMPVYDYVNDFYKKNNIKPYSSFKAWRNKELDISFKKKTNVLTINYKNKNTTLIIDTLNLISKKYKDYSKRDKEKNINKSINYLKSQHKIMSKKTEGSIKKYNKFAIKNGIGTIDGFVGLGESNININGLSSLGSLNNNLNSILKNVQKNDNSILPQSPNIPDAGQRFQNQFNQLEIYEAKYLNLSSKLKPNSQTLRNLKLKIDKLKDSLKRPNEILLEYKRLYKETVRNESLLTGIDNNLEIAKLEKIKTPDAWEMISIPTIDKKPIYPNKKTNVIYTFLFSLFSSSFISLLKEKKSGKLFEFNELCRKISCKYLDNILVSDKNLSSKIIESLIQQNKDDDAKNINFMVYSNDVVKYRYLIENNKKFNEVTKNNFDKIENFDQLILLIEPGGITNNEILILNKYISLYKKNIIGWVFLDNKN